MSLIITPKAAAQVVHAAAESGQGQPVLRVAAKRDRDGAIDYAMGFDEPREEDTVSLQHGVRLLIAPTSMELLNDTVLDFVYMENEVDPQFAKNIEQHILRTTREDPFHVSANTDPKGDRSKTPQEQDPDMLLHVVKETDAGIIVRGAKFETAASYANQAFVKPTIAGWAGN